MLKYLKCKYLELESQKQHMRTKDGFMLISEGYKFIFYTLLHVEVLPMRSYQIFPVTCSLLYCQAF